MDIKKTERFFKPSELLKPERQADETYEEYRQRRKAANKLTKEFIKGKPISK